jgi:hypothetical protein
MIKKVPDKSAVASTREQPMVTRDERCLPEERLEELLIQAGNLVLAGQLASDSDVDDWMTKAGVKHEADRFALNNVIWRTRGLRD